MINFLRISVLLVVCLLVPLSGNAKRKKKGENKPFVWEVVDETAWTPQVEGGDESGAIMLFERIVDNDSLLLEGKLYRTLYRRILITSEKGRDQADIEVPFYFTDQNVNNIQGRTVLPKGEEILLDEANIFEKDVVRLKGEKITQKSFSMPGVTDSCIIEYVIKYRLPSIAPVWKIQKDIPLLHGELTWKFFKFSDKHFSYVWYQYFANPAHKPLKTYDVWENVTFEKSRKRQPIPEPTEYVYRVQNVPPLRDEPFDIPDDASSAKLYRFYGPQMLPIVFWSNITRRITEFIDEEFEESQRIGEVASKLRPLPTSEEKARAAYTWLQENTLNLSFLTEEQALEIIKKKTKKKKAKIKDIDRPDDVVKNGYGKRWDINLAFCVMLRALDIDAKIAFSVDRTDGEFNREVMHWQFDRYVTVVFGDDGDTMFFAPGEVYVEPGMVPWYTEGTIALEEGTQGSRDNIPYSPASASTTSSFYTLELGKDLNLTGKLTRKVTGHRARPYRLAGYGEEESAVIHKVTENLEELYPDVEVSDVKADGIAVVGRPLEMSCKLKFPELSTQGSRLLLNLCDYIGVLDNPFSANDRTGDIRFRYAYETTDSVTVAIPNSWTVEGLPPDSIFQNEAGQCSIGYETEEHTIKMRRHFVLTFPRWSAKDYPKIKELFEQQEAMANGTAVFVIGP